jgi:beta-lactamase class C
MIRGTVASLAIALAFVGVIRPVSAGAGVDGQNGFENVVARAVLPVMKQYKIPGMAVAVLSHGKIFVYNYGMAETARRIPVSGQTLFEIGSVSKTFTATLTSYAQVTGKLSLSDTPGKYLPSLRGTNFDRVSLLNLGTHTAGGFPLQFPDDVQSDAQMMVYFEHWKPVYAPGTYRTYANPGIALLGLIAAKSMHADFSALMTADVFRPLGLRDTYLAVPQAKMQNYAQGYTKSNAPVRMKSGVLAAEAYGVRTTAADLARFLAANMGLLRIDPKLQRAITNTHTGYYRIGPMTQDLIWEQYRYPLTLKGLLAGNSSGVLYDSNPATALAPPMQPRADVLLDKTGSTNGFGTYVAFIPGKKSGVVLLASKNYPIAARVSAAYQILTSLSHQAIRCTSPNSC